jgi:hypothetical protein
MRRSTSTAALALATVALVAVGGLPATAGPGQAARPSTPETLAEHLAGPLSFDVGHGHDLYVAQSFSGALTLVGRDGSMEDLVAPTGLDIAAVSVFGQQVTWAETVIGEMGPTEAVLKRRAADGTVTQLADLRAYEESANPDQGVTYGFQGLSEECLALIPPFLAPYPGIVDSHPYGSASTRGVTYVADAGANAVLRVDDAGNVSTVAVLPATPVMITAEMAEANGVDPCVAGHTINLESVPTDVEIGLHGELYVTSLPGGPEDPSLGANGSVYKVDPKTGQVTLVATGFLGATGVAVEPNGTLYVAELFGNQVSMISKSGVVTPVATFEQPAAVEWDKGRLYVSTNVFGDGSIVSLKVG